MEKRKPYGDLEADLVMGKGHSSGLLVTTDCATLFTTIEKLTGKNPNQTKQKMIAGLKKMPQLKKITFHNDKAFRHYEIIAQKLDVKTHFNRPYTSRHKVTVENRNGIICMFFPKKTDFHQISKVKIKWVDKNSTIAQSENLAT